MVNNFKRKRAVSTLMRVILYSSALALCVFLWKHPPLSLVNWESLGDVRETGSEFVKKRLDAYFGSKKRPRNLVHRQLRRFGEAQESYREKHLRYGSIAELVSANLLDKTWLMPQYQCYKYSLFFYTEYQFELVAIVMPNDYGWQTNYFVDQSGVTRWAVGEVPNRQSYPIDHK